MASTEAVAVSGQVAEKQSLRQGDGDPRVIEGALFGRNLKGREVEARQRGRGAHAEVVEGRATAENGVSGSTRTADGKEAFFIGLLVFPTSRS